MQKPTQLLPHPCSEVRPPSREQPWSPSTSAVTRQAGPTSSARLRPARLVQLAAKGLGAQALCAKGPPEGMVASR